MEIENAPDIFNSYVIGLKKTTDLIEDILKKIAKLQINQTNDKPALLSTLLLERTFNTALSCKELIPLFLKDSRHEYSLGLILRTSMLDLLISLKMHEIISDSEDVEVKRKIEEFSFDILRDGFDFLIKQMKDAKSINSISQKEWNQHKTELVKNFQDFFHQYDGESPKLIEPFVNKRANPNNLYKSITKLNNSTYFVTQVYDKYSLYSKYEHINLLYKNVLRASINEKLDRLSFCFDRLFINSLLLIHITNHLLDTQIDLSFNCNEAKAILDTHSQIVSK